jgi:hypothetical protein
MTNALAQSPFDAAQPSAEDLALLAAQERQRAHVRRPLRTVRTSSVGIDAKLIRKRSRTPAGIDAREPVSPSLAMRRRNSHAASLTSKSSMPRAYTSYAARLNADV